MGLGKHLRTQQLVPILPTRSVEDAADNTIGESPNLHNFAEIKDDHVIVVLVGVARVNLIQVKRADVGIVSTSSGNSR